MARKMTFFAALCIAVASAPSLAQDTLNVAVGGHGNWDSAPAELGTKAGFFGKEKLKLEILYTAGSGETLQTVISGSADIGVAVGTGNVMAAYQKGAPVRVIGSVATGTKDVYWYVQADSPIKRFEDADPKTTIAFSTAGSSTFVLAQGVLKQHNVSAILTKTGGPQSTLTQVMSGQVDIGYATAPFALKQASEGQIRILGNASEVPGTDNQTVRIIIANAHKLNANPELFDRFMRAYRQTVQWMYSDPKALVAYSKYSSVPVDIAKRSITEFYSLEMHDPYRISGLQQVMADAITLKLMSAPLDDRQLAAFVRQPPN